MSEHMSVLESNLNFSPFFLFHPLSYSLLSILSPLSVVNTQKHYQPRNQKQTIIPSELGRCKSLCPRHCQVTVCEHWRKNTTKDNLNEFPMDTGEWKKEVDNAKGVSHWSCDTVREILPDKFLNFCNKKMSLLSRVDR